MHAGMSQLEFGQKHEIGNQGMVWQYLNADKPKGSVLNVSAAIKFAAGLSCRVSDFSPSLQGEIDRIAAFASDRAGNNSVDGNMEIRDIAARLQKLPREVKESTITAIKLTLLGAEEMVGRGDAAPPDSANRTSP